MHDCLKKKKLIAVMARLDYEDQEEKPEERLMGTIKRLRSVQATSKTPRVPSKGLMFVEPTLGGKTSCALIDTSASHNFISIEEAKQLGLNVSREER